MSRKLFAIFLSVIAAIVMSQPTFAHVLIQDDSKNIGAILHVDPEDDPIAGQPSYLYFDMQRHAVNSAHVVVTNTETGENADVAMKQSGGSLSATYVFPVQGVYRLTFTVAADRQYTFTYTQRVSRGVLSGAQDTPSYPLAMAALIFCGSAFLLLLVIAFNRRRAILRHSTF